MWDSLDEMGKYYYISEDKYKNPWVYWEKGDVEIQKEGTELDCFEEFVYENKGEYIYFFKQTILSEEELAKMKKSKPKNLNLTDLN